MKKGEKVLLVLGALLIAAGVFVGVTLGWDYSPDNYAYNDIAFTSADTETGECSFVSVQLSDLEVNIYSTTDKTVSIAARGAKTPARVSVVLDGGVLRITEKKPGLFQRLAVSDDDAVILRIPEKWVGTVDAATQSGDVCERSGEPAAHAPRIERFRRGQRVGAEGRGDTAHHDERKYFCQHDPRRHDNSRHDFGIYEYF